MNIAIVSPGPFSVPPVTGSSVEHDIDEITRVIDPKHHVTIYTRTCPTYPASSSEGNRTFVRFSYDRRPSRYLRKIIKDLRTREADVILVENRPSYVPALRKAFPHKPIVLNMHSHVYASKRMIEPVTMRRVGKMIDGMITNSEYLRQHFIHEHQITPEKVHAIHLGVDSEMYHPAKLERKAKKLRKELGLSPKHHVLLYAGRLMREKGVHLLLRTFREISKVDPQARLVIVGGTGYGSNRLNPYVKLLRRLARPLGDKVKFVNFVPTKDMPAWYQLGDIVATPSLWQEPFCRVNLEAMAAGKPVITTARGGIPEVVRNQDDGFLVQPKDWKLLVPRLWQFFWQTPGMQSDLSKNARSRAQELSWQATAAAYLNVFERLVHPHQYRQEKKSDRLRKIG